MSSGRAAGTRCARQHATDDRPRPRTTENPRAGEQGRPGRHHVVNQQDPPALDPDTWAPTAKPAWDFEAAIEGAQPFVP